MMSQKQMIAAESDLNPTPSTHGAGAAPGHESDVLENAKTHNQHRLAANLHWVITIVLAFALIPASVLVKLHLRIDWPHLLFVYWVGFASQSIFVAVLLYLVAFPLRQTLRPMAERFRKEKLRLVGLAVFAAFMIWKFGWPVGPILVALTVMFLEFFDRMNGDPNRLGRTFLSFLLVGSYFFVGLLLVFIYNDVIASMKYAGLYDPFFNKLDMVLLGGRTISDLAHAAARHLSLRTWNFFDAVYFGMFLQLGAAPIILVLTSGRKLALQYVGTVLTAYYISLAVFFLWPSMGPFAICSTHDVAFPNGFDMYAIQKATVLKAHAMLDHSPGAGFTTDYYIGFPCMHIAQPLIVAWFLRKWKRMLVLLIGFDVVLVAAILLLEQHYLVDVLAGIIVAALAVALNHVMQERAVPGAA